MMALLWICLMGILGMGSEAAADQLWEDAAAYCQKMAVSGLEAPYQAGYMYLGGQLKFYVFDTPGVSYRLSSVHRKWC